MKQSLKPIIPLSVLLVGGILSFYAFTLLHVHPTRIVPKTSVSAPVREIPGNAELEFAQSLEVAGRHWVVLCKANHFYYGDLGANHPLLVFFAGLLAAGLLSGYLYYSLLRNDRIKQRKRTRELQETNETLSCQIALRQLMESELQKLNGILDSRVQDQTADLVASISQLRQENNERLKAEEQAKKTKDLLERTFASLNEVILVIDPVGRVVVNCNQAVKGVFGYEPEEVLGRNTLFLHVDQEMYQRFGIEQGRELETLGVYNAEFLMLRKNGDIFPVEIASSQIIDDSGRSSWVVAAVRDISVRQRIEAELRRTNNSLRSLSRCNHALVFASEERSLLIEICQNIVNNSEYPFAWVGYAMEDGTKLVRPVAHAGGYDGYLDSIRVTWDESDTGCGPSGVSIRTGTPCIVRDAASHPDCASWAGELREHGFASIAALPLMAEGKAFGMIVIYSDAADAFDAGETQILQQLATNLAYGISSLRMREARRQAEEALRESEELYRSLVENIEVGIHLVDENYRTVMANSAMGRTIGKDPAELQGKLCFHEVKGRQSVCPDCPGKAAMDTGKKAELEREILSGDGSRKVIRIQAFPVPNRYGRYNNRFIEVIEDVTEKKNAEAEKDHLELQLRQSQKMEAIGTLAGGIAHDFNNVLTAIIGHATLMQMKMEPDDPMQRKVRQILSASDRATKLTQGLLSYSRKQATNPIPVGLNSIINNVHTLLQRLITEDIELNLLLAEDELTVMVDTSQIEQVLMNLVTNARDAMYDGGKLSIATELVSLDRDFAVAHGYGIAGRYALLMVTDSGAGMDQRTRERIFEPFFTTKEVGKGTGLGLAMAYGIVKQHGGYINCYSEPGHGTVFRIYLPSIEAPVQIVTESAEQEATGGCETILLVEDDAELLEMVGELLENYGYTVIKAIDGEDGVEKFKEFSGAVRMVILDVIMPKMNGKDAFDKISALSPGIKALFMSGYPADIISCKSILSETCNLVTKPLNTKTFLGKVRGILDSYWGK
jgi:PAS domain S-box-containing protein